MISSSTFRLEHKSDLLNEILSQDVHGWCTHCYIMAKALQESILLDGMLLKAITVQFFAA
jgi:hypothetical protein